MSAGSVVQVRQQNSHCVCVCVFVSSLPPLLLSAGPKPQTIPSGNKAINSQVSASPSHPYTWFWISSCHHTSLVSYQCVLGLMNNILEVCASKHWGAGVLIWKNYTYNKNFIVVISSDIWSSFSYPSLYVGVLSG